MEVSITPLVLLKRFVFLQANVFLNKINFILDNASDIIHAGTLCLGTQVEVIIDMENPSREPLKYKMALKSILLNGHVNLMAVSVMLVSNYPDVILFPNSNNEIKVRNS